MTCAQVEEQLPSYIDGERTVDAAAMAAHLATCDACRASAHAQTVARTVLKARAAQLSPIAPPGLLSRSERASPRRRPALSLRAEGRIFV